MDPLAFAGAGFEDDVPFPGEDWLDLAREYGPLVGGDSSNFEGPTNHAYLPFPPYNLHGSTAMSSQYLGATFAAGQSNGAQAGAGNSLLGLNVTADEFVPHRDASRAHDRGYPINYGRQGGRNRTLDPKGMQRGASPPFPAQNISAGFDTGWSSGSSTGIASSGPQTPPRRLMSNDPAISSRTSTSSLYRQINSFMTPSPSSQQSFRGLAGTGPSRVQSADEPWRNWQGNQNYPTRSLSQQNGQVRPTVASTGQRPDRSAATGPAQLPSTNMLETLPAPSRRAPHWEPAYSLGDRTIVHRQTLEVPTQFQENNPNVRQAPPSTTSRSCEHPGCRCKRQFDSDAEYRHHTRWHGQRDHVCDLCSQAFVAAKDLERHWLSVHRPGHRPFFCEVSGCTRTEGFKRKDGLKRHLQGHGCSEDEIQAMLRQWRHQSNA